MNDVLVVGFGPAGAAAAIAAHDAGARVVVLEASSRGGGNAVYSAGFLFDAPEPQTREHLEALSFGRTDRAVLDAYAVGLHGLGDWLDSLGAGSAPFDPPPVRLPAPFPSWPYLPGGNDIRYRVTAGGAGRRGEALWQAIHAAVTARGIPVRYDTRAIGLAVDIDGAVIGVEVEPGVALPASAVILACGGFEGDPALAEAYLPLGPTYPVGHPDNVGDGLRMAHQVDAALWHMYGFFGWFAFRTNEFSSPFAVDFFGPGHIMVDADGRRFADETGYEVHDRLRALLTYLPRNPNRPRLPSWGIFDEATRLAGPLNGLLGTPNDYTWSADNSAEVSRGWILAGSTVDELAAKMGAEPAVLAATLDEYNDFAAAGRDERFSRDPETLVPLDTGRLYAIETWPGVAGTTGGPRHDRRARVLRADGVPVCGLYAAGAVSMVWGHLIDHGGGLTNALVFGRIAGTDAASLGEMRDHGEGRVRRRKPSWKETSDG
jgi:succinate dehydrogenase/fumarate reductase flavoprotein subunit